MKQTYYLKLAYEICGCSRGYTTAIYAKIVDEKMKEASELIPELKFGF
ncbi:hypothetical protein NWE55_02110 [Myroides albus]|nr:hypothetical protein [Myroides albus]UVD80108.1 hypothetical protein NWE55_02110 [Myroides albus]